MKKSESAASVCIGFDADLRTPRASELLAEATHRAAGAAGAGGQDGCQ